MTTANQTNPVGAVLAPTAVLALGGREITLRMTMGVLALAETASGLNFMLMHPLQWGYKGLQAFLWANLQAAGEKVSLADIGDWVTPRNLGDVADTVTTLWKANMPEVKEAAEQAGPFGPAPTPTGSASTPPPVATSASRKRKLGS